MKTLWPRSLRGQMIALVLIGLGVAQVCSFAISRVQHQGTLRSMRDQHVLARITSVVRLLAATPPALHAHIVRAASAGPLRFTLNAEPVLERPTSGRRGLKLCQKLARLIDINSAAIRIGLRARAHRSHAGGRHDNGLHARRNHVHKQSKALAVAVPLGDGRWLNTVGTLRPPGRFWEWSTLLSLGLSALILSLLMIWMVRRITHPLARLAASTDRFGRGEVTGPLTEQGPTDIQHAIRAFNLMRARLERFVQDRTRMLAAISHDLRTPMTALRVRAELIREPETRGKILATLDEMQHMTEATLVFVREDATQEDTRLIDLAALVGSLCDDLSDAGKDVTFSGPDKTPYRCRSVSLKRALGNLVENAVTYGQRARVTLTAEGDMMRIEIDDDGLGIAESDIERVFEPFVRLEASRSRETGGVGLGMAIARSIIRQHGGDITLANRAEGGLRVAVHVPVDRAGTVQP